MAGKEISEPAFFVGAWLPSYMTEPHLEIGAAFPDFFTHLLIAALGQ